MKEEAGEQPSRVRPAVLVLLLASGILLPLTLVSSLVLGRSDPAVSAVGFVLCAASGVGAPLLLRGTKRRGPGATLFVSVIVVGLVTTYFAYVPFADWYHARRCLDGVAAACVDAYSQGSADMETDDFWASRRACTLGEPLGCGVALKYAPHHKAETCSSATRICKGELGVEDAKVKRACRLVQENCGPEAEVKSDAE